MNKYIKQFFTLVVIFVISSCVKEESFVLGKKVGNVYQGDNDGNVQVSLMIQPFRLSDSSPKTRAGEFNYYDIPYKYFKSDNTIISKVGYGVDDTRKYVDSYFTGKDIKKNTGFTYKSNSWSQYFGNYLYYDENSIPSSYKEAFSKRVIDVENGDYYENFIGSLDFFFVNYTEDNSGVVKYYEHVNIVDANNATRLMQENLPMNIRLKIPENLLGSNYKMYVIANLGSKPNEDLVKIYKTTRTLSNTSSYISDYLNKAKVGDLSELYLMQMLAISPINLYNDSQIRQTNVNVFDFTNESLKKMVDEKQMGMLMSGVTKISLPSALRSGVNNIGAIRLIRPYAKINISFDNTDSEGQKLESDWQSYFLQSLGCDFISPCCRLFTNCVTDIDIPFFNNANFGDNSVVKKYTSYSFLCVSNCKYGGSNSKYLGTPEFYNYSRRNLIVNEQWSYTPDIVPQISTSEVVKCKISYYIPERLFVLGTENAQLQNKMQWIIPGVASTASQNSGSVVSFGVGGDAVNTNNSNNEAVDLNLLTFANASLPLVAKVEVVETSDNRIRNPRKFLMPIGQTPSNQSTFQYFNWKTGSFSDYNYTDAQIKYNINSEVPYIQLEKNEIGKNIFTFNKLEDRMGYNIPRDYNIYRNTIYNVNLRLSNKSNQN